MARKILNLIMSEIRFNAVQKYLRKLAEQDGYTVIVARLTPGELSAVRWGARQLPNDGLETFLKTALREHVRLVANKSILNRHDIPQLVAEWLASK